MLKKRILASSMASVMALTSFSVVAFAETKDVKSDAYGKKTKDDLKKYVESKEITDLYESSEYQEELKTVFDIAYENAKSVLDDETLGNDDSLSADANAEEAKNAYTSAYILLAAAAANMTHYTLDELAALNAQAKAKLGSSNTFTSGLDGDFRYNNSNYETLSAASTDATDLIDAKATDVTDIDDAYVALKNALDGLGDKLEIVTRKKYETAVTAVQNALKKFTDVGYPGIARFKLTKGICATVDAKCDAAGSDNIMVDYAVLSADLTGAFGTLKGVSDSTFTDQVTQTTNETVRDNYNKLNEVLAVLNYVNSKKCENYKQTINEKSFQELINKALPALKSQVDESDSSKDDEAKVFLGLAIAGTKTDAMTVLKVFGASDGTAAAQITGAEVKAFYNATTGHAIPTKSGWTDSDNTLENYLKCAYWINDKIAPAAKNTRTYNNVLSLHKSADRLVETYADVGKLKTQVEALKTQIAATVTWEKAFETAYKATTNWKVSGGLDLTASDGTNTDTPQQQYNRLKGVMDALENEAKKYPLTFKQIRDQLAASSIQNSVQADEDLEAKIRDCAIKFLQTEDAFNGEAINLTNRPDKTSNPARDGKAVVEAYEALVGYEVTDPNAVPGDADLDGVVTPADATAILKHIVAAEGSADKLTGIKLANADCDGNAGVTPADATWVLKKVASSV